LVPIMLSSTEEAQLRALLVKQTELLSLAASEPSIISELGAGDTTFPELTPATVINDADLLLVRQGTEEKSATGLVLKNTLGGLFAAKGANSDITSLSGLTTALSIAQGGTGSAQGSDGGIKPVTASVAANALTVGINPCTTQFRSTTLTGAGLPVQLSNAAALTLVVPSGATLGTVSAVASTIIILEINNAGTKELAVVNLAGGNDLTETGLINTTVMSSASDSANVIYSTTARTGVAYRVVGSVVSTQTTAGTWAQALVVTGDGGQALAVMSSLGYGQTWQSVAGSRVIGTTYYNTTGKPIIAVAGVQNNTQNGAGVFTVNGVASAWSTDSYLANAVSSISVVIPHGASYILTSTIGTLSIYSSRWSELR